MSTQRSVSQPERAAMRSVPLLIIAAVVLSGCGGETGGTVSASAQRSTTTPALTGDPSAPTSSTTASGGATTSTTGPASATTTTAAGDGTASTTPTTGATVPAPPTTTTTTKPRPRPPGPPGPIAPTGGPDQISETVKRWYDLLVAGSATGACQPVLDDVQRPPEAFSDGIKDAATAYATLYKGAAEGCLGQPTAAATDLAQARELLAVLETNHPGNIAIDKSCQPGKLLAWAYDTYLNQTVAVVCPPR